MAIPAAAERRGIFSKNPLTAQADQQSGLSSSAKNSEKLIMESPLWAFYSIDDKVKAR